MASEMTRADVQRRIVELKAANIAPLDWRTVLVEKPDAPLASAEREALSQYFSKFMAPPTNDAWKQVCPCCQSVMRGGIEGALLGGAPGSATLQWGFVHGEASCSRCGWPYRVYHYDIGGTGDDAIIKSLTCALPVHPSGILLNDDTEDEPAEATSHA